MRYVTERQRDILNFIRDFQQKRGVAPTHREICDHFGFSSYGTVYKHLSLLEKKGLIRRDWNQKRGVEVVEDDKPAPSVRQADSSGVRDLPLFGYIAAGRPLDVERSDETIPVPEHLTTRGEKLAAIEETGVEVVAILPFTRELAEHAADEFVDRILRDKAHDLIRNFAILEDQQGGDSPNAVPHRRRGIGIYIHLHHLQLAVILVGNFVDDRSQSSARTAPCSPEVHQYRLRRLENIFFKVGIVYFCNVLTRHLTSSGMLYTLYTHFGCFSLHNNRCPDNPEGSGTKVVA